MTRVNNKRALVIAAAVAATMSVAQAATTGWNQTAAGTYSYSDTANWVGGEINGVWDSSLTLAGAQTVTFGSDFAMNSPWVFNYLGKQNLTLRSDGTANRVLTLNSNMVVNPVADTYVIIGSGSANQNLAINLSGASRIFDVQSGGNRFLDIRNAISGTNATDGVIKTGAGALYYNNGVDSSYTGQTQVSGGTLWMSSTSRVTGSDFRVTDGATLRFDSSGSGFTSMSRTKSLTLINGNLTGTAGTTTTQNTNDQMGTLAIAGASSITLTPPAARNMQMTASSLALNSGGTLLIRGTALGTNALSPATVGAANFVFTNIPTLTGVGAAASPGAAFIKGVFGDTNVAGAGSAAATGGLVTYDAAKGVRLLDTATEYETRVGNGSISTTPNNVRVTGAAGENRTMTIGAGTTSVGSLTLVYAGTTIGGSGVTVDGEATGTGTLQVSTGVIQVGGSLAGNTAGLGATDAFYIKTEKLDLNGTEGMVRVVTPTTTTGSIQTAARLYINSEITNDNGNGLTLSSGGTQGSTAGMVSLGGTLANTYTGTTTVNGGIVMLAKPAGVNAVPADLVLNSGSIYLANHNQISDAADVTIKGGALVFADGNNSGSGRGDNFATLTMTGGSTSPASANGQTVNITGDVTLSGGQFGAISNGKITIGGLTTLSGGRLGVGASRSTPSYGSLTSLNGGLSISNIELGSYTPITISGDSTNRGGKLVLAGDVNFAGNAANPNTVTIAATAATNLGVIALEGTRLFTIGDGAASHDLTVQPGLVDGTTVGGLTKAGAGTLVLTGVNTYTGGTSVNQGKLVVNGSLAGPLTITGTGILGGIGTVGSTIVDAGATLSPGNSPGLLSVAGDLQLNDGSKFMFELGADAASSDQVAVSGALILASQEWSDFTFVLPAGPSLDSYVLFTTAGGIQNSLGSNVSGDLGGNMATLSVVGNELILSVPEPGMLGLAAFVSGASLLGRRRQRAK